MIYSYPVHLNHLSIISINSDYEPWFYSNYIQLSCPPEFPNDRTKIVNFFNYDDLNPFYGYSPFTKEHKTSRLEKPEQIIPHYKGLLKDQKYINIFVDDFYLAFRPAYKLCHTPHELFLFGYDNTAEHFHVLGYDTSGKPKEYTVFFSELVAAYMSASNLLENYTASTWMHFDYQFEYNKNQYGINLSNIISLLESYINSTEFELMPGTVCGVSIYKLIKEYYYNYYYSLTSVDVRPFHLLWEHKNLMYIRMKYLQNYFSLDLSNYISSLFDLQQNYMILRNKLIKCEISKNRIQTDLFYKTIDSLVYNETQLYSKLIKELKKLL